MNTNREQRKKQSATVVDIAFILAEKHRKSIFLPNQRLDRTVKIGYICIYYCRHLKNNMVYQTLENQKELIRVSISEAARLFGVNAQTIRRAISAQEITYVVVGGRYKLNFESLVKWSQRRTTTKNKLAKKGIGQFVEQWKIKNPLYSPNPKALNTVLNPEPGNDNHEIPLTTEVLPTPIDPLHTT